jgi:hypothetical protein
MLDFLRSLAPRNLDGKSSAVAALPSRFEIDQPLRSMPVPSLPANSSDDAVSQPELVLSPPPPRAEPDEIEDDSHGEARVARAPVDRPLEHAQRNPEVHVRSETSRSPIVAANSMTPRVSDTPGRSRERSTAATPEKRSAPALPAPAVPSPTREAIAAPSRGPAPTAARTSAAPLSAHAVAARVATRAESRPVVHVTIDRVDVRVPAAAERSKPSARRSPSASPSLSDYLRARQSDRRGGRP